MRGFSSNLAGLLLLAGAVGHTAPAGDSAACRPCHQAIVDAYAKTGMGRSITASPVLPEATFYHRLSNRHYTAGGGKIRRHQRGADGQEIQVAEKAADFGIGSGNHAVTFVHRTPKGLLIELPLSWYRERNGYAMSPGYDAPDHPDMRREISNACLFCHAAYPRGESEKPASIDCERCHGDTRAHLARPQRGTALHPGKLPADRQLAICLQCHLQTASQGIVDSVLRPGRGAFSFRPGEALGDFKTLFDRADSPGPRFEVNHAGYRLLQSACFQKSGGAMTCTTCHDPHTAKARNACGGCHESKHAKNAEADCAGCHMPKRRPSDAIHVTMTDHWIQRRPQFQNPEREAQSRYTGPVVPFYGEADPLQLAIANIRELTSEVPALYQEYLRRTPDDAAALAALGNALARLGRAAEAIPVLERALQVERTHVGALNTLAVTRAARGEYRAAIVLLERAREAHPDHSLTWANLGVTYRAMGQRTEAIAAFREAIRLQPDLGEARQRLAEALAEGR
ncbi:MAG TPA: tetratricopeptide repeat protein [Bryobacteraceae bacterium]|nr:tetratricopeptide repeat protein [Bryobacteraceae bacterium]